MRESGFNKKLQHAERQRAHYELARFKQSQKSLKYLNREQGDSRTSIRGDGLPPNDFFESRSLSSGQAAFRQFPQNPPYNWSNPVHLFFAALLLSTLVPRTVGAPVGIRLLGPKNLEDTIENTTLLSLNKKINPIQLVSSSRRSVSEEEKFSSVLILGDPQLGRARDPMTGREEFCSTNSDPKSKDCRERSEKAIINYFKSAVQLCREKEKEGKKIDLILINGDLTEFQHGDEAETMRSLINKHLPLDIQNKIYINLGNHDYANNKNDCFNNNCASRGAELGINVCYSVARSGGNCDIKRDECQLLGRERMLEGSLAYSFDKNEVHFVQLQNYPTYFASWEELFTHPSSPRDFLIRYSHRLMGEWDISKWIWPTPIPKGCIPVPFRTKYSITSSLDFLEKDLEKASAEGKPIIISYHDPQEHFVDKYPPEAAVQIKQRYREMLEKHKVAAVFTAHFHDQAGLFNADPSIYKNIPVFGSGSAAYEQYLLVDIHQEQGIGYTTIINATGGNAVPQSAPVKFDLKNGT